MCSIPCTSPLRLLPLLLSLGLTACVTFGSPAAGAGPTRPYGGSAQAIPGLIEVEHYDEGGPEEAYSDSDPANHGADYRGPTHVDIEQRPDASNGHGIGWTRAGEWLTYTVVVREPGIYTVEFPVASRGGGGVFHLEIAGVDITGPVRIPDTGAWTKLERIRAQTIRLAKGTFVMKMIMDANGETGGIGDIDYMRFIQLR